MSDPSDNPVEWLKQNIGAPQWLREIVETLCPGDAAPAPPAHAPNGRWVRIGQVSVDSSQIGICDPGYAKPFDFNAYWNSSRSVNDDCEVRDWCSGVAFMAGFGDGGYVVWAWVADYRDPGADDLDELAELVAHEADWRVRLWREPT